MKRGNDMRKLAFGFVLSAVVALCAARAWATDYVWNSGADGDWEEPSNWSPSTGYPSAADDTATIPNPVNSEGAGSAFTVTVNTPFSIAALSVAGTAGHDGSVTLLFKTGYSTNAVSGDITLGNHATVTHFGPNTARDYAVVLKAGGNFTIAAGASVNVDQKGYTFVSNKNGYGPGAGRDYGRYGGETEVFVAVGIIHGSVRRPVDYGASVWYAGANSPGAIHLIAGGTLTVNGEVRSCGTGGEVCGSSGGSIWLECGTLVGDGSILARGGVGTQNYCGSGGRISIVQRKTTGWTGFTGTYDTGLDKTDGKATCGTIYLEDASDTVDEGTLVVDNANRNNDYMTPLNFTMTDATNAFGQVVVRNYGKLRIVSGLTMKVTKGISVSSNGSVLTEEGGAIEFVGSEDATVAGGSLITVETLICTNAGKTIRFGTAAADKLTIPLGKTLIFRGEPGNPVTLASTTDGTRWPIAVNANAGLVDVRNVAVKDSDASSSAGILAIDSTDLGNNLYWGFSAPIAPGAAIEWTGAADTAWQNPANWNPARVPVDTDVITIPSVASAKYPVLGAGTFLFNNISVGAGASLTLNGPTLTVTNLLAVAGTLTVSGAVDLYLAGNVDFVGGTINHGSGRFLVSGAGDQTLDFGNCAFNKLIFLKPSGNVSFGTHGFTANSMQCAVTTAIEFTFAAGSTYSIADLALSGASGGTQLISLKSSSPGIVWNLIATEDGQSVSGVSVADSDASGGATIMAGTSSVGVSGNVNWDFETDVAIWTGGTTGSFNSGSSWSTGRVPGADTAVVISAGDGETVTATLPAGSPMTFKSLTAKAGAGGTAKFVADSPVVIRESIDIQANGVVELNAFDENGTAPNIVTNNVRIRSGGILSHTGPNDTESKKLHIRCLGTFTVDAGGAVDVTAKGYTEKHGIGWVRCYPMHAGTASSYASTIENKYCYGSIRQPTEYGSGAGADQSTYGGGTAILEVPGIIDLAGSIVSTGNWHSISGGAGGSILLRCGAIAGNGLISAAGGNGHSGQGDFSGSGGRIAIYRTDAARLNDFTGTITTMYRKIPNYGITAACGTIYYEDPDDEPGRGTLVIDDDGQKPNNATYYTDFNAYVTDANIPFGTVVVTNSAKLRISEGANLRATKGIIVASGAGITTVAGTVVELCGTNDAVLVGASRIAFNGFVCTNVEKRVYFETGSSGKVTIPSGASLMLSGLDSSHPLSLLPLGGSGTWQLQVDANAAQDVKNVAVQNSDASSGAAVLAIDSTDLGGNSYWSFSSVIEPGETIVWTGGVSADWADGDNWDRGRAPVETDDVVIERAGEFDPTLSSGTYLFNRVRIRPNAALTLNGATLTVTNLMLNSGTLKFAGAETLYLTGDAFFTNGTVVAAQSYVRITGSGAQTIDFGNTSVGKVYVENPVGPINFTGHGFAAKSFNCAAASSVVMTFEPGALYDFDQCYVNSSDAGAAITLASRIYGSQWRLKVYENATGFGRVAVRDCDASAGAVAYGGRTSVDEGNNVNWNFSVDVAVWIGRASGDFDDAANWSTGMVPSNSTRVVIMADDGGTAAVTVPAASSATIGNLVVGAGVGGSATLAAKGALTVCGDADVRSGGTLTLNAYNDFGPAPNVISNNLTVAAGGTITHSGPAASENAKVHLAVFGGMTVEEGGTVSANGKGYTGGNPASASGGYMCGAAHAGYAHANKSIEPYGSIFCPTNWGASPNQISGGGAVHLVVAGALTVNGGISADGEKDSSYGGCGGSVWIECATLSGSGTVSAREGRVTNANYAGSGGRIAVYQRLAKDFSAFPKSRILASDTSPNSAGTVYLEAAGSAEGAWLYIENGVASSPYATMFPMAADGDAKTAYQNVNLIIGHGGWVTVPRGSSNIPQEIRLRSLSMTSSASILDLGVNTFVVTDPAWRRDKDWARGATVNVSEYNKVPGKILWLSRGSMVILR